MKKIPPQNLEDWEKELQKDAHNALKAKHGEASEETKQTSKRDVKTAVNVAPTARKNSE